MEYFIEFVFALSFLNYNAESAPAVLAGCDMLQNSLLGLKADQETNILALYCEEPERFAALCCGGDFASDTVTG